MRKKGHTAAVSVVDDVFDFESDAKENPFQCSRCGFICTSCPELFTHLRTHEAVVPTAKRKQKSKSLLPNIVETLKAKASASAENKRTPANKQSLKGKAKMTPQSEQPLCLKIAIPKGKSAAMTRTKTPKSEQRNRTLIPKAKSAAMTRTKTPKKISSDTPVRAPRQLVPKLEEGEELDEFLPKSVVTKRPRKTKTYVKDEIANEDSGGDDDVVLVKRHGPKADPVTCGTCGAEYYNQMQLQRHETTAHLGGRSPRSAVAGGSHKCGECSMSFAARVFLLRHMMVHTGERPHKCSVCGKGFIQIGNLNVHMRMHQGERCRKSKSKPNAPTKAKEENVGHREFEAVEALLDLSEPAHETEADTHETSQPDSLPLKKRRLRGSGEEEVHEAGTAKSSRGSLRTRATRQGAAKPEPVEKNESSTVLVDGVDGREETENFLAKQATAESGSEAAKAEATESSTSLCDALYGTKVTVKLPRHDDMKPGCEKAKSEETTDVCMDSSGAARTVSVSNTDEIGAVISTDVKLNDTVSVDIQVPKEVQRNSAKVADNHAVFPKKPEPDSNSIQHKQSSTVIISSRIAANSCFALEKTVDGSSLTSNSIVEPKSETLDVRVQTPLAIKSSPPQLAGANTVFMPAVSSPSRVCVSSIETALSPPLSKMSAASLCISPIAPSPPHRSVVIDSSAIAVKSGGDSPIKAPISVHTKESFAPNLQSPTKSANGHVTTPPKSSGESFADKSDILASFEQAEATIDFSKLHSLYSKISADAEVAKLAATKPVTPVVVTPILQPLTPLQSARSLLVPPVRNVVISDVVLPAVKETNSLAPTRESPDIDRMLDFMMQGD